jgi:hypothetical protein
MKKNEKKPVQKKRPPRAIVTREEALKRMETFPERREQFLATARTGKS